ncbi:DNA repair-scaffolding protein isoform X3 [Misgurnus anguillicaudatus]|uniref:DNA repair-scaffolding protein isoform X3 n=1 Tax=Misgurnus anguillicaudatus TaxID=75329 RepID=UPI003CCF8381
MQETFKTYSIMSKRKRNLGMRCVLFPDDVNEAFRKGRKEAVKTSTPAAKSWKRCGDSFLDTSVIQNLQTSEKKMRDIRKVIQTHVTGNEEAGTDEPVHIAWSSSEEEESDGDNPPQPTVTQTPQTSRAHKQHHFDYYRSLRMLSAGVDMDDLPSIDSDSEVEEEESTSKDQTDFVIPAASPAEISVYSSNDDEDPEENTTDYSLLDPAETSRQSVSEWVRSAQAILQTPQKQTTKTIKTPEDSSKKSRKFERGGLAEKLNRLHRRQRSAISFWRHRCNSSTSAADRPGVLTLRILGVREECGMQAAVCDRLPENEKYVAMFSKDTAAQLHPTPGDIVHIYPPWLCALVQDGYGMFGDVLLQYVSSDAEVQQISEQVEGKVCVLQGLRVIQRLTRDKCSSLFSMIDSLWPPLVAPKSHENLLQSPSGRVPPPSFCYRLSVQQGHMIPLSGQTVSPLYRSPVLQTLREIIQDDSSKHRCSFRATLVHKQSLSSNAGESEMLLFVTDPSLQTDPNTKSCRKIVPVCLSPSCLIRRSVKQALDTSQDRPILTFRDAVKEQGQIFCVEQTLIQLEPEDPSFCIPRPIILDQLCPETSLYSLCTLTGIITEVDESTAFSWPVCSHCGSCRLETAQDKQEGFRCLMCGATMDEPTTKMQLDVFLNCPSLRNCTVKVKLQQKTISSLLNSTMSAEGYTVESVLGTEIGPLSALVHVIRRSHSVWMGLEELTI